MLIIRLSRTGRKNLPDYNIVVTEKTHAATSGRSLEKIGYYSPVGEKPVFEYQKDRLEHHLKNGAQVSDTLARLFHKDGVAGMEKYVDLKKKFEKRKKGEQPEEEAPAPAAPAESAEAGEGAEEAAPAEAPAESAEEPKEEEKAE